MSATAGAKIFANLMKYNLKLQIKGRKFSKSF